MFENESDDDERLISREHKEYHVGEQLPVFPVTVKTGTLHSGLGKRTESGDSGISVTSVNFSTATEEVEIKQSVQMNQYKKKYPERFCDELSSDEFNQADTSRGSTPTLLSIRDGHAIEDVFTLCLIS